MLPSYSVFTQHVAGKRRAAHLGIVDVVNRPKDAPKGHKAAAMVRKIQLCVELKCFQEGSAREDRMIKMK